MQPEWDDSPYYRAASLAMYLTEAQPGLHEDLATDIAWQTWKEVEPEKFRATYSFEVMT
jgi:hypothetical protein